MLLRGMSIYLVGQGGARGDVEGLGSWPYNLLIS